MGSNITNITTPEVQSESQMAMICSSWLYEPAETQVIKSDVGKWILFYNDSVINEKWLFAKKLYRNGELDGVMSMKCSINYDYNRAYSKNQKVIVLYCNISYDGEIIKNIGKNILKLFEYKENDFIYYETDTQTHTHPIDVGSSLLDL